MSEDNAAIPFSIRLRGELVLKLYLYAEQMGKSPAELLGSLLEDAFSAFEQPNADFMVKIRAAHLYTLSEEADLLHSVDRKDLEQRLLKRLEPGGPVGRPAKPRKI